MESHANVAVRLKLDVHCASLLKNAPCHQMVIICKLVTLEVILVMSNLAKLHALLAMLLTPAVHVQTTMKK
jgi:hypothetical protein